MEDEIEQLPDILQDPLNVRIIDEIVKQGGKGRPKDLMKIFKRSQVMSRQTLFNRLKLLEKGMYLSIEYTRESKGLAAFYSITEKARQLLKWAKDATTLNEVVATWPSCAREYKFAYDWGEEVKAKTSTIRYLGDSALGINVSYKGPRSILIDIYRARVKGVEETIIREIMGAAKALSLLDVKYFTGEKSWRDIPYEDLEAAFREIISDSEEIVYIESLTPQKLFHWLQQPKVLRYLGELSDNDPSVPSYSGTRAPMEDV